VAGEPDKLRNKECAYANWFVFLTITRRLAEYTFYNYNYIRYKCGVPLAPVRVVYVQYSAGGATKTSQTWLYSVAVSTWDFDNIKITYFPNPRFEPVSYQRSDIDI